MRGASDAARARLGRILARPAHRHELVRIGGARGWWIPAWAANYPGVAYCLSGSDGAFEDALRGVGYRVHAQQNSASLPDLEPRRIDLVTVGLEHVGVLASLLAREPRPGVICVRLGGSPSLTRMLWRTARLRAAGYSLARMDGWDLTFARRSSYAAALRRRALRTLRRIRRISPPARLVLGRSTVTRNLVALTFDDGPSTWTESILDTLGEAGARATFFVVGASIAGREHVLQRMLEEGHEIGNHTFTHPQLDQLGRAAVRDELSRTNDAIARALGRAPRLFRPPYFAGNEMVFEVAGELGLEVAVYGPVWTEDWALEAPEAIAEAILAGVHRGAIAVLHDGRPPSAPAHPEDGSRTDRRPTADAVRLLVPALQDRGYELVTVSELLAS